MNRNPSLWDALSRKHPTLLFAVVVLTAAVATVILLSQPEGPVVLYQAF